MHFVGRILYFLESLKKKLINSYLQQKYAKEMKKIGRCVKFNGISFISGLNNIEIGNNVHIGENARIKGEGGLYIGDNTHISRNLVLYTVNHNYKGSLLPYDNTEIHKPVVIEKNVWIGINVTILPGTHIQEGAIIGAGAVVGGKVPKGAIYGAALGKIIKYRDLDYYEHLEKNKKYGAENGNPIKKECI